MLAFWGALIVGVVLLVRWLVEATTASSGSESSLDILQRRYAAGEITREEYQQMRQVLER
ncbi:MAG: SHOCT domain-containing protein [Chloroflexi bacterium]|nr:SHOCT domain-containing protein [Chloroflexota bacterium]